MSVVIITDAEGIGPGMYDAVNARLDVEHDPPEGQLAHIAGFVEEGHLRVVDVWESQEAHDRFRDERLMPAIAATAKEHGMELPGGEPNNVVYDTHHFVVAGAHATA